MKTIKSLRSKFEDKIIDAKWEEEAGATFLRVTVNEPNLEKLTLISREISDYLDSIDDSDKEYYLDVASEGTDKEISFDELKDLEQENISVTLKRPIKDKIQFEGELVEVKEESLIIKWNAKGQFRKQELSTEDIEKINLSAKVTKENKNV